MATVQCETGSLDGFDDGGQRGRHPFAVADAGSSAVVRAERDYLPELAGAARPRRPRRDHKRFHRLAEVRQQQGVTLRNVSRRLGIDMGEVRRQEQSDSDLRISDLLNWQQVLEVPIAELLVEAEGQLSGPVLERSRMVKLMKTAAAIREQSEGTPAHRLAVMLVDQILEIMPELRDVTPWHNVGQRRSLDDVGRAARCTVSDDVFRGDRS